MRKFINSNIMSEDDIKFIDCVWEKLDKKLSVTAERSREKIPYTTINGVHDNRMLIDPCWWTNGFWSGIMWHMYYGTKNDTYKKTAIRGEELLDKAFKEFDGLHHDVGFMWIPSSCANYKITGNNESRIRTMYAANILAGRYNLAGKFIRAWNNEENEDVSGWVIIDCMMNLPLLYWASDETNDPRYKFMAMEHADTTMKNHIRPDGSVKHIVSYNAQTGEYIENFAGQGYSEVSAWSRGQAWAIYGFILSYIHTGKEEYLDTAKRVAHYFISNVADDNYMVRVDFRSPLEPVMYDSTAAACAVCGLIEIAKNVPEYERKLYYSTAIKLLRVLDEHFCNYELDEDSILQMGTERWKNDINARGVHIPIIYGDYYFVEAIYKLKGFDISFE